MHHEQHLYGSCHFLTGFRDVHSQARMTNDRYTYLVYLMPEGVLEGKVYRAVNTDTYI